MLERNHNNRARMVAGYCYEWVTGSKQAKLRAAKELGIPENELADHPALQYDIKIGDFTAKWNLRDDKTWITSPCSFEQVGYIHTSQGLELDYTCVLWDADMRCENRRWHFYQFNGQTRWTEQKGSSESNQEKLKYMLNAYRVLLTRARAGMVICVPAGNANKTTGGFWEDSTRLPEYYNGTY